MSRTGDLPGMNQAGTVSLQRPRGMSPVARQTSIETTSSGCSFVSKTSRPYFGSEAMSRASVLKSGAAASSPRR